MLIGKLAPDASVWLNLLATDCFSEILSCLAERYIVPMQVLREVRRSPRTGIIFEDSSHPLRNHPAVEIVRLDDAEVARFFALVSAKEPDGLDDGEAAILAIASMRAIAAGIDERKARRIAREQYPSLRLFRSAELLQHDGFIARVGRQRAAEAYEQARQFGRMHIPRV